MFPGGVLAVHELRYVLAYGAHAGHELNAHGDTYVGTASLLAGLLLVIPAAGVAVGVVRARRGDALTGRATLRPWQSWLVWTVVLTLGFCALEGLEMIVESEHPDGFAGVFGGGGWWALPAAAGIAAVFTLVRRGARALVRLAARVRRARSDHAATVVVSAPVIRVDRRARLTPLASRAAGRAPPGAGPLVRQSS